MRLRDNTEPASYYCQTEWWRRREETSQSSERADRFWSNQPSERAGDLQSEVVGEGSQSGERTDYLSTTVACRLRNTETD